MLLRDWVHTVHFQRTCTARDSNVSCGVMTTRNGHYLAYFSKKVEIKFGMFFADLSHGVTWHEQSCTCYFIPNSFVNSKLHMHV